MKSSHLLLLLGWMHASAAADCDVPSLFKLGEGQGGFAPGGEDVGTSVTSLGDLDGDGVEDLAVGQAPDAVWIVLRNPDGSAKAQQKIAPGTGGFTGTTVGAFGSAVAGLGDLDGDGVADLAVGSPGDGPFGPPGELWILFLNADGTVKGQQEISSTAGGFLGPTAGLGASLAPAGDFDGDGTADLFAGDLGQTLPGSGQVWLVLLAADGTVKSNSLVAAGLFGAGYGSGLAALGDLDGNGTTELAVGSNLDAGGGFQTGSVSVLFLDASGAILTSQKLDAPGALASELESGDRFGTALAPRGDLDGDGVGDLAASAPGDDDGGTDRGAVYLLFLNADGTLKASGKLSATQGGLQPAPGPGVEFGASLATLGDLDGDGVPGLAVGVPDDGLGVVWVLYDGGPGEPAPIVAAHQKVSNAEGGLGEVIPPGATFGRSIAALGDFDGDGVPDVAVGANLSDEGGASLSLIHI